MLMNYASIRYCNLAISAFRDASRCELALIQARCSSVRLLGRLRRGWWRSFVATRLRDLDARQRVRRHAYGGMPLKVTVGVLYGIATTTFAFDCGATGASLVSSVEGVHHDVGCAAIRLSICNDSLSELAGELSSSVDCAASL